MMSTNKNLSNNSQEVHLETESKGNNGIWKIYWTIAKEPFSRKEFNNYFTSLPFLTSLNTEWSLKIYPRCNNYSYREKRTNYDNTYVSVYLTSFNAADNSALRIPFKYTFAVLNKSKVETNVKSSSCFFPEISGNSVIRGFDRFISRQYVLDQKNCLVDNDEITFVLELIILKTQINYNTNPDPDFEIYSQDFAKLFNSKDFSDFTISVGDKQFHLHKAVLSARSAVFAAMFKHPMKENATNTLEIADAKPGVVEQVLVYIYIGKCSKLKEMAFDILPLANLYGLNHLKVKAEESLLSEIGVSNVCEILVSADLYNAALLKSTALEFINTHVKEVMTTDGWTNLKMRPDLILDLFLKMHDQNFVINNKIILQKIKP